MIAQFFRLFRLYFLSVYFSYFYFFYVSRNISCKIEICKHSFFVCIRKREDNGPEFEKLNEYARKWIRSYDIYLVK